MLRITYGMFDENGNLKNPPKAKEQDNGGSEDDGFVIEM